MSEATLNGWTARDLNRMSTDLTETRGDVRELKHDMGEVKGDMREIKLTLAKAQSADTKRKDERIAELEGRPRAWLMWFGGPVVGVVLAEFLQHVHL